MAVRRQQKRRSVIRPPMRSPGRPSVSRREHRHRFWSEIAQGVSSEDAGKIAGVSPAVGCRWFREGGGMPTIQFTPLSGRYLSFAEREEIAILRAQEFGVRAIARKLGRAPSTISRELRRNAATRSGWFQLPCDDGTVARRPTCTTTEGLRSSPRTRRYVPGYRNASRAASVRRMVFR